MSEKEKLREALEALDLISNEHWMLRESCEPHPPHPMSDMAAAYTVLRAHLAAGPDAETRRTAWKALRCLALELPEAVYDDASAAIRAGLYPLPEED